MLKFLFLSILFASASVSAASLDMGGWGGAKELSTTLVIKSDGTCVVTNEQILNRAIAEQQVLVWEQFRKRIDQDDEEDETAKKAEETPSSDQKPMSDEELTRRFREIQKTVSEQTGDEGQKIETMEVGKETVRIVSTRTLASLQDMLRHSYSIFSQSMLTFENVRLEADPDGRLRLTLSPYTRAGDRYIKTLRQQWKVGGAKMLLKIIFPGAVVSSGLPKDGDTSISWTIDGGKDESVEAAVKLYSAPIVVTADAGGLKIPDPLESKTLRRSAGRSLAGAGRDVPVVDARPGFVAEAVAVTTSSVYYFSDGQKYLKNQYGFGQTGLTVRAKLFAPKGITIQGVSELRVLKATDDRGRSVPATGDDSSESIHYSSGRQGGSSVPIELRLNLPSPDAQAIDELSAEAVATTVSKWKELELANLKQNATNEIDLSSVLPDAKLVITKVGIKNRQLNIQAQVKGPETIGRLQLQCRIPGNERFNAYSNDRSTSTKGNQSQRTVNISGYIPDAADGLASISLLIRYPEDLRRERVAFKLSALDLF